MLGAGDSLFFFNLNIHKNTWSSIVLHTTWFTAGRIYLGVLNQATSAKLIEIQYYKYIFSCLVLLRLTTLISSTILSKSLESYFIIFYFKTVLKWPLWGFLSSGIVFSLFCTHFQFSLWTWTFSEEPWA